MVGQSFWEQFHYSLCYLQGYNKELFGGVVDHLRRSCLVFAFGLCTDEHALRCVEILVLEGFALWILPRLIYACIPQSTLRVLFGLAYGVFGFCLADLSFSLDIGLAFESNELFVR